MLGGGKHAVRKLKRAQILLAADAGGPATRRLPGPSVSASPPSAGPSAVSWKAIWSGERLERGAASGRRAQADRQGGGPAGGDRMAPSRPWKAGRKRWTLTLPGRHDGQAHRSRQPVGRDRAPAGWPEERSQAMAQGHVVHSPCRWRIRRPHGGRARSLRRDAGSRLAAGLRRRDPRPANRRGAPLPVPAQPDSASATITSIACNGTVNLFVTFDPHRGWRNVKVTDRRAAVDYAQCMRELVDVHYPDAACIRVVQDNLSIHKPGALYEAFAPAEGSTHPAPPRIPLHSETRQLAQHGRVRDQRAAAPVSRPPHRRSQKASETKSQHGNGGEIKPEPASNGCSQPTKPAPNSAALIQPPPKSQNHCDEPLVCRAWR